MRVDIWSDVVCPWCLVGTASFEEAVRRLGWEEDVEVRYHAYELDPTVPPGGLPMKEYLQRKFGPRATIEAVEGRIEQAAEPFGITFDWKRAKRVNTRTAHRLIAWALDTAGPPAQRRLKRRLMDAHFTEGLDVDDHATLARLAGEAGLDTAAAAEVLASDAYLDAVRADREEAKEREIHAVPTFVIEGRLAVPGAQAPETFVAVLARARERFAAE